MVEAQEAELVRSRNIQSEKCLKMLDFMNCINKEFSHILSELLTLPSQLEL